MTRRICVVLTLALLAALRAAIPRAWAQEPAEKSATEQGATPKNTLEKTVKELNPADKSRTENNSADGQANFPQIQGPVELHPARGTRVTLKLTDSSRVVYEAIARQAKIGVLFDPDYTPRQVSVDLNGASFEDALTIVAFESRTFWRPVTSDVIFVAADTQAKRREFEQQMVKTLYFPDISSPTDLQDIVNGLRTIVEVQRIQQMPSFQTITVRATPEQMAITEKLIEDINRARQKTARQYRLEYRINEFSDEKKLTARTYMQLVEPHQVGKLRIGWKVPLDIGENKKTYSDVGKNIDCGVVSETEHTVSLRLAVELSEIAMDEHGVAELAHGNPIIQGTKMETNVTLELGTPTTVSNFQDPVSKHNVQIEMTAIRIKSKE